MTERILIVEDDPDIVRVVEAYLEREGFVTEVTGDGETGLASALAAPPALIVLDWMLPQLDGEAFMKRLRPVQATPVIMLTARGEEDDRLRGDCKVVLGYVNLESAGTSGFVLYAAQAAVRNPDASQENVATPNRTHSWTELGSPRSGTRTSPRCTA